jgi:TRAP-type C4-dicarboxylate transport system permease small subunit
LEVVRDKGEIPEDTQLQGIAQAILSVSLPPGFPLIIVRELEKDTEIVVGQRGGKTLPAFPLGLSEQVHRHTALL